MLDKNNMSKRKPTKNKEYNSPLKVGYNSLVFVGFRFLNNGRLYAIYYNYDTNYELVGDYIWFTNTFDQYMNIGDLVDVLLSEVTDVDVTYQDHTVIGNIRDLNPKEFDVMFNQTYLNNIGISMN